MKRFTRNGKRGKATPATRSPLKGAPLRHAGQSLQDQIHDAVDDGLLPYHMVAGALIVMAVLEWWRWYTAMPPAPWIFTVSALIAVAIAVYKFRAVRRKVRRLRQARDGERAVGEFLERLRGQGYVVLHDLPGDRFNVDHVLIGPAGVFTVETKTISKPSRGKAEVDFDGRQIIVGEFKPDRDPVVQGRAQAGWLRGLIETSTGKRFPFSALVVYPGWYVNSEVRPFSGDVTVLNPKGLPALLGGLSRTLSDADIKMIAYHLSRLIRTADRGHIVQGGL